MHFAVIRHMMWSLVAVALASGASAHAAQCYDVSKGEPKVLEGDLQYVLFAGPPNFEDVQKGDTPEPTYVLKLDHPICIRGDEFAEPEKMFETVQLVGDEKTWPLLRANVKQRVSVTLKDPMGANTGHHHEPLVAWVANVTPATKKMNFVDEYGSAATTIRAFYETLGSGQGDVASTMVVAEKRAKGPFSAESLTRFYSHLKEPIRLVRIDQSGPDTFIAHYRYATGKSVCNGQGLVTTVNRSGRNYIQSIRALKGC
ncbi:MAG TPA: hypothetical protein VNW53_12980 [Phenylobacterium sp.]|jgi:hypothetical protein|uniref:hypothetical protein n=1 Tax=Phenylobacterium sp. TaxID=1871053 RepID=UPI002BE969EE|nr:hypothetical protein [Phenylobacterium sp.]HXA39908.1 hypothetical protein [Phenylobacterium sp.]